MEGVHDEPSAIEVDVVDRVIAEGKIPPTGKKPTTLAGKFVNKMREHGLKSAFSNLEGCVSHGIQCNRNERRFAGFSRYSGRVEPVWLN
jgi:hypothetical protein